MQKLNYLNVGCGSKIHKDWVNVDMVSNSPDVIEANLIKGIPFPDNHFDVVYHSQVLEHIPKEKAKDFINECYRVLKHGGIIRIVVPDLENIIDEYKNNLNECLKSENDLSTANYDWILLEMYDQTVRNNSGGQMAAYLESGVIVNKEYIVERIGFIGSELMEHKAKKNNIWNNFRKSFYSIKSLKNSIKFVSKKIVDSISSEKTIIGSFRLGGEIHMWMYDRYSLSRLMKDCKFDEISIKNPFESNIPNWEKYQLDVKDGKAYDPKSLFVEAIKK